MLPVPRMPKQLTLAANPEGVAGGIDLIVDGPTTQCFRKSGFNRVAEIPTIEGSPGAVSTDYEHDTIPPERIPIVAPLV